MKNTHSLKDQKIAPLVIGWIGSIFFIIATFFTVQRECGPGYLIPLFSFCQIILQLICFLQMNMEEKPRWKGVIFLFTLLILLIVIVGSLWVMNNLNHQMMPM
ncbi:MAG: cytochrome C oxidase subunit IV family protein [Candidatus Rhabdochlamydia sp.]